MELAEFIRQEREGIDRYIAASLGQDENPRANDNERRLWVLNDEALYLVAKSRGVDI